MARQSELVKFQVADQSDDKHLGEVHQKKEKPTPARRSARNVRDKNPKNVPSDQPCSRCNRVHKQDEICPGEREEMLYMSQNRPFCCCLLFRERSTVKFREEIISNSSLEPWNVVLHINRKPVQFKIDTGADISVISVSTYEALPQRPKLKPSNAVLSSPGGMLNCKGQFTAEISLKNKL